MADSWRLVTPTGSYDLNPSFSAPKYQAGGVATPGALRRDERSAYQRSGDGLATPGPLRLNGRVWRDTQDIPEMVSELNAIRAAVATCTQVVRTNSAGTYTYGDLAGGPTPAVTPDGLGGFEVAIELWPGRAEATFVPSAGPPECEPGWIYPGDLSAPAQLPSGQATGYYVVHKGRLYIISGGAEGWELSTTVRVYDPATDTWGTAPDLAEPVACFYPTQAVSLGDWIYVHDDNDMLFYRYNPDTGVTQTLTPSNEPWPAPGIYDSGLVELEGLIYRGLLSEHGGRVYNPGTDTWADVLGTAPAWYTWEHYAVDEDVGDIIVSAGDNTYIFTPSTGAWTNVITRDPGDAVHMMVKFRGELWFFRGNDTPFDAHYEVASLDGVVVTPEALPPGFPDATAPGAVALGDMILLWGGDVGGVGSTSVWKYQYCDGGIAG